MHVAYHGDPKNSPAQPVQKYIITNGTYSHHLFSMFQRAIIKLIQVALVLALVLFMCQINKQTSEGPVPTMQIRCLGQMHALFFAMTPANTKITCFVVVAVKCI